MSTSNRGLLKHCWQEFISDIISTSFSNLTLCHACFPLSAICICHQCVSKSFKVKWGNKFSLNDWEPSFRLISMAKGVHDLLTVYFVVFAKYSSNKEMIASSRAASHLTFHSFISAIVDLITQISPNIREKYIFVNSKHRQNFFTDTHICISIFKRTVFFSSE